MMTNEFGMKFKHKFLGKTRDKFVFKICLGIPQHKLAAFFCYHVHTLILFMRLTAKFSTAWIFVLAPRP